MSASSEADIETRKLVAFLSYVPAPIPSVVCAMISDVPAPKLAARFGTFIHRLEMGLSNHSYRRAEWTAFPRSRRNHIAQSSKQIEQLW
jgi:hypothetical protein